jgi:hypothetical protein
MSDQFLPGRGLDRLNRGRLGSKDPFRWRATGSGDRLTRPVCPLALEPFRPAPSRARNSRASVPTSALVASRGRVPLTFADGNGDGVGDLAGIRSRLGYLERLGIDAIWLSPIYPSPLADFGYDVAEYCDVDSRFGNLADLERLVAEAHDRGIRVLLDWVPNHTSNQHPWFLESRSSPTSPKREWYIWRDGRGDGPPNNWRSAFGGPAWTFDDPTGQWYLHVFLPEQPDLNWGNREVQAAMHDTLRFWLDRGVDGFRADVIHLIGKDPALADQDPGLGNLGLVAVHDDPRTHELLRGIRRVLDEYPGDRMMVGEVNLRDTIRIATYHGAGDELHLAFNFLSLEAGFDPVAWRLLVGTVGESYSEEAWPGAMAWVVVVREHCQQRQQPDARCPQRHQMVELALGAAQVTRITLVGLGEAGNRERVDHRVLEPALAGTHHKPSKSGGAVDPPADRDHPEEEEDKRDRHQPRYAHKVDPSMTGDQLNHPRTIPAVRRFITASPPRSSRPWDYFAPAPSPIASSVLDKLGASYSARTAMPITATCTA